MRNLITTAALLVLLDSQGAIAQTIGRAKSSTEPAGRIERPLLEQDARLIGNAPVGHRQPRVRDVPSENSSDLEHVGAEDAEVDRKLNICRGC
jgi:hypothetical protein